MKTIKIIVSLAVFGLLLNLSAAAYGVNEAAQPPSPQKPSFQLGMYRKINTMAMKLLIEKKLGAQLVVMLLDERGKVLHKESLGKRRQKYGLLLDFENTPDGLYTVVVKNGEEQLRKEIRLSTQTLYEMPKRLLTAQD